MEPDLAAFMARMGYRFRDAGLLTRALTHRSRIHEITGQTQGGAPAAPSDNEQLEFLGDAVLGFLVSDALIGRYPSYPEGQLSKLKARIVSEQHLHQTALALGLGEFLILGRGEELSGGRLKRALLSDALEALIAGIYLDGGVEAARAFVVGKVIGDYEPPGPDSGLSDFKSELQQTAHIRHLPAPRYALVREHGPEHAKTFTMEVRLGKDLAAQAEGRSKKEASQEAARLLLERMAQASD
jgi:ribonuclease-3